MTDGENGVDLFSQSTETHLPSRKSGKIKRHYWCGKYILRPFAAAMLQQKSPIEAVKVAIQMTSEFLKKTNNMAHKIYQDGKDKPIPPTENCETGLTVTILRDLVITPSFVDKNTMEDNWRNIQDLFQRDGHCQVEQQKVRGRRANLIIHDRTPPKIVLFGRLDTVEPSSDMTDPFGSRIEGNKLHGLGAVDMKASLAIAISSALRLKNPGLALIFTVDEESKFKGVEKLVEKYHHNPRFVV